MQILYLLSTVICKAPFLVQVKPNWSCPSQDLYLSESKHRTLVAKCTYNRAGLSIILSLAPEFSLAALTPNLIINCEYLHIYCHFPV